MHKFLIPVFCILALSATDATKADETRCPSEPFGVYAGNYYELFACVNGLEKRIDKFLEPPYGVNAFEVERPGTSTVIVVNVVNNLAADSRSVSVTLYDTKSGERLLSGHSKASVVAGDINSDGITELVLYENILAFSSLLLSDIGWPTIIELGDSITIGMIEDYNSLRERLLRSSIDAKSVLEEACIFDGVHDPLCGAADDIKALKLFIDILSTPHPY